VQSDVNFNITPNADALNSTGKSVQGKIGSVLREELPDLGPLNDQYSGLSNAEGGLARKTPAEERKLTFSIPDILAALSTGGAGALAHGPEGAAVSGLVGLLGSKALGSDMLQSLIAASGANVPKVAVPAKALRNFYLAQN